ncbi:hypothetical protein CRM22_008348 [Opisthorchis felineus]|uniref:Myb-like domain-containing protein n=1 Tax=Opisthorchis felineus TaxID=147828 RepID=A0A4S2LBI6_OPIFE|nr:hypothetical protein CRM22_008348 [Opisthorchis felineus]
MIRLCRCFEARIQQYEAKSVHVLLQFLMMDHLTYSSKSPEKSSPSFPEDIEDEDDDPIDIPSLKFTSCNANNGSDDQEHPADVTMLVEADDDDLGQSRSFHHTADSPRNPTDSSDKKVHWSNQNVQTLLDCVEKHLDEFNVQKKHKQVWQTIGAEMETLGFTMEHCYNKWKNLRRDVRLLVNNPQKAVRNADILRRVARLILVIYPNIDATTMQVAGDRNGGKSAPATPVGLGTLNCKVTMPSALHAPDSPRFGFTGSCTPQSLTPGFHSITPNGNKYKHDRELSEPSIPGTALFTNMSSDNDAHEYHTDSNANSNSTGFPFIFNPAAAALLVQSQLFNDLLLQQQRARDDDLPQQREQLHPAASTPNKFASNTQPHSNTSTVNGNGLHVSDTAQAVSLASSLLNGLAAVENNQLILPVVSASLSDSAQQLNRLPPGSELAGVVERLRDEETIHMKLTDMVTHLATELHAAGMRRRAALDQLLGIMQGARIPSTLMHKPKTADASNLV